MDWLKEITPYWMSYELYDVNVIDWLVLGLTTALMATGLIYLRNYFYRHLASFAHQTETSVDDMLVRCLSKTTRFFLLSLALVIMAHLQSFSGPLLDFLNKAGLVVLFFQIARWGNVLIAYSLENYFTHRNGHSKLGNGGNYLSTYGAINITAKFILWVVLGLLLLDNLGVNITALVTGLGIGGIAIALAMQNILGDIFASLTIILDKPFEAGDFIIVGAMQGTVESVGLKTTRIRSLSGEQWVYPNKQLIESGVQNYKRMIERRIQFGFGLVYDTPVALLAEIPRIVQSIIEKQAQTRFDRAHFKSYGSSSLDFEIVYFICSSDYNHYMDVQQEINLEILRQFAAKNISFAFPTRQLVIQTMGGAGLTEREKGVTALQSSPSH